MCDQSVVGKKLEIPLSLIFMSLLVTRSDMNVFKSADMITGMIATKQPNSAFLKNLHKIWVFVICMTVKISTDNFGIVRILQAQAQGSFAHFLCVYFHLQ